MKENGIDGEMETSEAAEALLRTSQSSKELDRLNKEVQDVVNSVRESSKQKKKRVKQEAQAQKKLNEDQALVEIKDAISRGEYRQASRLAVDITAEGKDVKPILEKARSELLTENAKSNLSRTEKKQTKRFINVATNGAKNFGRMKQKYGDKRRNIRLEESLEKKLDEFNLTLGKKKRWGAKEETRTSAIEPSEPAPTASLNSVKKSKDLSSTSRKNIKPFKGEGYDGKSKKFKSKEEAQRAANDILSKNIPCTLSLNFDLFSGLKDTCQRIFIIDFI